VNVSRLQELLDDGIIDEVYNQLKTGKEAEVWLVSHRGEPVAAKLYKEREFRSFKNDAGYKEGRQVRNSRTQRAMDKGSAFGRKSSEEAWKSAEADALYALHAAGVRVPKPVLYYDGVLLMEVVGDAEGRVAPRLVEAAIPLEQGLPLYLQLRGEIIKMLAADLIHGDLSEFNILLGAAGPVIIDFPQVVTAAKNSLSEKYFRRDLGNLLRFFGGIDPAVGKYETDADEIWRAYVKRELSPGYVPTGRVPQGNQRRGGPVGRPPMQQRGDRPPQVRTEQRPPQLSRNEQRPPQQRTDQRPAPQRNEQRPPPQQQRTDQRPPPQQQRDDQRPPREQQRTDQRPPQQHRRDDQRPPREQPRTDQRAPQQQRDDQRPPQQQRTDQRAPQQQRDDQRPPQQHRTDQRAPQQQRDDQRPPQQQRTDQRAPQQRDDQRPPREQQRTDQRPPQQQRTDQRPPQGPRVEQRPPQPPRRSGPAVSFRGSPPSTGNGMPTGGGGGAPSSGGGHPHAQHPRRPRRRF
jgi:RIO kinase 1